MERQQFNLEKKWITQRLKIYNTGKVPKYLLHLIWIENYLLKEFLQFGL